MVILIAFLTLSIYMIHEKVYYMAGIWTCFGLIFFFTAEKIQQDHTVSPIVKKVSQRLTVQVRAKANPLAIFKRSEKLYDKGRILITIKPDLSGRTIATSEALSENYVFDCEEEFYKNISYDSCVDHVKILNEEELVRITSKHDKISLSGSDSRNFDPSFF